MKTYTPDQLLSKVITGGIFPPKLNITSPDGNDTGYMELDSVTATALAAWIAERFPCAFSAGTDEAATTKQKHNKKRGEEKMNTINTNAHTPGPWHVEKPTTERKKGTFATLLTGVGGRGFPTCEFEIMSENYKNSHVEANARLIAAAPEVLQALNAALEIMQIVESYYMPDAHNSDPARLREAIRQARLAIAKATGQD